MANDYNHRATAGKSMNRSENYTHSNDAEFSLCFLSFVFFRQYALQPGCWTIICSHSRAYEYFAESVHENNSKNFIATQCNSMSALRTGKCTSKHIPMGIDTPHTARGNYYLETNKKAPFGRSYQKYANIRKLEKLIQSIDLLDSK